MADSPKLIVLKALTELIEQTQFDSDADTHDLIGLVFRGRMLFGANDPDTMVSIVEAPQGSFTIFTDDNQARKDNWVLLLQGWCPDDKENPSDPVYRMMWAVEQRLARITKLSGNTGYPVYRDDYMLGGLIADFQFGPGIVRPPTSAESSKAFFYLPLQVVLASDVG